MSWLLRYQLAEAASGSAPSSIADSSPTAQALTPSYNSGDMEWTSDGAGNGLNMVAATRSSPAIATASANAALIAAMTGRQQFTLYLKTSGLTGASSYTNIFDVNVSGTSEFFLRASDGTYRMMGFAGRQAGFYGGNLVAIVVDTTQAVAADIVKVWRSNTATPEAVTLTENNFAQGDVVADLTAGIAQMMNIAAGGRNPNGALKFLGVWDAVATPTEVTNVFSALYSDDDADPSPVATLGFVSGPTASGATSGGFAVAFTPTLDCTADILVTESATQPSDAAFDAATAGGAATGYAVYNEALTGLDPDTAYYVHVRLDDGTDTVYGSDSISTLAVQNAIISINGGNPIRYGDTGIVVLWDGGATGTTSTTINGVAQANHTVVSDTETTFDFVWPATTYGSTETLDINGTTFTTPSIEPPVGYSYDTVAGYNASATGALTATSAAANSNQVVWATESDSIYISPALIPSFSNAFDGTITWAIVDHTDGDHSAFVTTYYSTPADLIPGWAPGFLGNDIDDAEPGSNNVVVLTMTDIDPGEDVTVLATGMGVVSTDGVTYGSSITRQLDDPIYFNLVAGALSAVRTGGLSANGVADSITVTTRAPNAPTITTHPSATSVTAGVNASFTAAATNVSTWQWQKDTAGNGTFVDISGATSATLSYPTTIANNTDQFRAVATSAEGGTTTTNAATLTVIAAAATLTTDILQDRNGAIVSTAVDIEVWTVKATGQVSTLLWSGQATTSATGVAVVTNNAMGTPGDYVDVAFPGLNNSESVLRYQLT
ncbi:MAG: hypothetical protein GY862_26955 [Gammaproteobacteria bacterium]|nr:hypothetical protein [Gammaproteobacteria bacterium]MCP5013833.1 hypothetical protein [Ketobacter sp.]